VPPLRVAVLTSSSAPGIGQLLVSPDRGVVYDVACVVSTADSFAERKAVEDTGVPLIVRPLPSVGAAALGSAARPRAGAPTLNLLARQDYDRETADILRAYGADYAILDGYKYFVTAPLLDSFPNRLLGIYDADLTVLDEDGGRRYRDLHGVRRAIFAGDGETRSSVFFITERPGAGPLMLLSAPFPVAALARDAIARGEYDLAVEYARLHQQWMTRTSWGAMLLEAIRLLAAGTFAVAGDVVWIDGVPGPCRLGDAPRFCRPEQVHRGIPASCPFIQT
jgi:folate-dependent phosphoribosylglycinamide formyltransferase PurN